MDINACNPLRDVDSMLDTYRSSINTIIDLTSNLPDVLRDKLWGQLLSVDHSCKSNCAMSGKYKPVCLQCTCLKSLSDLQLNKPFVIEYGSMRGTMLVINRIKETTKTSLVIDDDVKKETLRLVNLEKMVLECGTPDTSETTFLRCDPVTSYVLVSWLIESALKDGSYLLTAYSCGNSIYEVSKLRHTISNIDQRYLNPNFCASIVCQVIACMKQLSKYHFTHGSPDPSCIRITEKPCSKQIGSVHVYGQMTIGIDPGDSSSITTWRTRVCSDGDNGSMLFLKPQMESRWNTGNITLYKISSDNREAFVARRRSGVPIYPCSLDLYCLLVGLYCDPRFRPAIVQLGWNGIWLEGSSRVESKISAWKSRSTSMYPVYSEIMSILEDEWMRCDIVDLMLINIQRSGIQM